MTLLERELSGLKDFQRATVEYVLRRYFGPDPTRRFLVADEVGMGKTMVARGVIAGTIDELRSARHKDIERIDVLYVCSNAGIAQQNLRKLDVLGEGVRPLSTRITLLATQLADLNQARADGEKIVNLIALTPGTSFSRGHSTGRVDERALLFHFSRTLFKRKDRRRALNLLLRGDVNPERWKRKVEELRQARPGPDRDIFSTYRRLVSASPVLPRLKDLVARTLGRRKVPADVHAERSAVIGELRHLLARAGVDALEPDLIILDEFQRFRHLLAEVEEADTNEFGTLARALFEHSDARLLLLSATPYKLYTLAEERGLDGGDDHYRDFLETVRFLAWPHGDAVVRDLGVALTEFRDCLVAGGDPTPAKARAEALLRSVMSRTERPTLTDHPILRTRIGKVPAPTEADLLGWVNLRRLAKHVGGEVSVEYWKSAPYFLNFMDGYQLSRHVKAQADDPEVRALATAEPSIRREALTDRLPIEPGNARLRALQDEVLGGGMHRLLWMPPSMPYHAPAGPFAQVDPTETTKRLIFSSWAAAPSSIAALLSHEVLRRLDPDPAANPALRLAYKVGDDRPERMTALNLTIPQPGLAEACDPLLVAREQPATFTDIDELVTLTVARLSLVLPETPPGRSPETWYWLAPLSWPGGVAHYGSLGTAITRVRNEQRNNSGLLRHLQHADDALSGEVEAGNVPDDLLHWVAMCGLAAPANCAWRALRRVLPPDIPFADDTLIQAAAMIGEGFRSLFNRAEVMRLIDETTDGDGPYWQQVLRYCLGGNLQAVLDEYLHHLVENVRPRSDEAVLELAERIAHLVAFGRGRVEGFDATEQDSPLRFNTRFALRFGNARGGVAATDEAAARATDAQEAFNSPFWPFVLASTSVGQEGVDFHWWCHSLVHWNLPANVVDLEQREGRVHRYKGHAVRKNVAAAHREAALSAESPDPWTVAFEAAGTDRPADLNELWPAWIYPGEARIECWVPYSPMSRDGEKELGLRRDRAVYRLAFGQPRQEDLLAILKSEAGQPGASMDLRPIPQKPVPS